MIFYKIEATIDEIENNLDLNDRKVMRTIANELCEKSESFYHKSKQQQFVFGVGLRNEKITFGMILRINGDKEDVFSKYQKILPFELKKVSFEEITFRALNSMLNSAVRNDFIYDDDEVLDAFEIGAIN